MISPRWIGLYIWLDSNPFPKRAAVSSGSSPGFQDLPPGSIHPRASGPSGTAHGRSAPETPGPTR